MKTGEWAKCWHRLAAHPSAGHLFRALHLNPRLWPANCLAGISPRLQIRGHLFQFPPFFFPETQVKVARYVMAGLFIACLFPFFFFFVISFYEACTLRDADESACNIHFAFVFQSFQPASVPCYCCGKADTSFFLIFCPRRVCCEKVSKQAAVWPFPLSTCRLSCV